MLKIKRKSTTSKEGLRLSIAAKRKEFEMWQRDKLKLSQCKFRLTVWESQHGIISRLGQSLDEFAVRYVYNCLLSRRRIKLNNQLEDNRCPVCVLCNEQSSHFLKCKHCAVDKSFKDIIGNCQQVMYEQALIPEIMCNQKEWRNGMPQEWESEVGTKTRLYGITSFREE